MRYTEKLSDRVCVNMDPDIWFDPDTKPAVKLCLSCPAVVWCAAYALDPSNEEYVTEGVWGGTTARVRAMSRSTHPRYAHVPDTPAELVEWVASR